ncbi:hypothetical protein FKW77_009424 [Venturia effusa]|uniref:SET domain-containing protein n=1 Tax=Venturia effusa TaxID=50376 RepID=A0A517LGG6_9PEZI|nr:hypothetical protein FKW77_009424 [Venturia effusa]
MSDSALPQIPETQSTNPFSVPFTLPTTPSRPRNHGHKRSASILKALSTYTEIVTSLYKVTPVPDKGLGVQALCNIPAGTRITSEAPILMCLREPDGIDPFPIYEAFESLTPAAQDEYSLLSASQNQIENALDCIDDDDDLPEGLREWIARIASIFECNNFEIGTQSELQEDGSAMTLAGVFPLAARMNHSCRPNVAQTWNAEINQLTIHAIRDILPGEELCDAYCLLAEDTATRQINLDAYGFVCACEVCGGDEEQRTKSDEKRLMIKKLGEELTLSAERKTTDCLAKLGPLSSSVVKDGLEDPVAALRCLEVLLKEEGLVGHDLAQWYSFANWHSVSNSLDESIDWQQKNYDLNVITKGRDHADTIAAKTKLARLKKRKSRK